MAFSHAARRTSVRCRTEERTPTGYGRCVSNAQLDARTCALKLRRYRRASSLRGTYELAVTAISFALAWLVLLWARNGGHVVIYALLLLPTAGFLVRLFMIQHDCGHGSFFRSRTVNDWVGRIIGVITLTPYEHWRHTHAVHHASSGNLDRRGIGDVRTLTVAEYAAGSRLSRLSYWLYRHPVVMFVLGPPYVFLLRNRFPGESMRGGWKQWFSTMSTNGMIAVVTTSMILTVGLRAFLWIYVPVVSLAAVAGVWLFYVQHQFEHTHWAKSTRWNAHEAALYGSSHYDLPCVLKWFTANIGMHHIHHLSSRIPYYRLPEVLRDHPEFRDLGRLTLLQSFEGVGLVLWDEKRRRLVSFRELPAARYRRLGASVLVDVVAPYIGEDPMLSTGHGRSAV